MSAHTPGQIAKHAPAPWSTIGRDIISGRDEHGDSYPVCRTFGPTLDVQQANARLIAAAPELLAALRGLVQWAEDNFGMESEDAGPGPQLDTAWQAIAKATGTDL